MKKWREYLLKEYGYGKHTYPINIEDNNGNLILLDMYIIDVEELPDQKRLIIYAQDMEYNNWVIWADIINDNQLEIIDAEKTT